MQNTSGTRYKQRDLLRRSCFLGNPNTHSVDEALQKPFGGINACCHLLLVLWGKN